MKGLIAGEDPFVGEVGQLCTRAGHDTTLFLVEDFVSALQSGYLLDDLVGMDVAIELHHESAATKHELMLALGQALTEETLVLSSALAVSTTQAGSWITRPERLVGFGVLPPLGPEGAVELAGGLRTAPKALEQAESFWRGLGYTPFRVADGPGLVRARIVCCLMNEAASALMEHVASAADIDRAMKLGTNYPLGPLEWADYIGLDTVLGVMSGLFQEWGDDRYRPAPLLRRMVAAGMLGRKTGQGFFEYEPSG